MSEAPIHAFVANEVPLPKRRWLAGHLSRMFLSRIKIGRLTIVTPSGLRLSHGDGGPDAVVILHRWRTLRRLLLQGDVSFAEAYMDGDWDSPDLPALIELAGRNMPTLTSAVDGTVLKRLRNRLMHRMNANTKRGATSRIITISAMASTSAGWMPG